MEKESIYIYGGGGHGKVILDIILSAYGRESIAGVFDDDPLKIGQLFYGTRVLGPIQEFKNPVKKLILAIGENKTRKIKSEICNKFTEKFITLIDPSALISDSVRIKEGTVVMPGVHINADAEIGQHCIINTGAIIEHDCIVMDYAHIAPGVTLTGAVQIGFMSLIGANSTIVPGIKVGDDCLIGAGSIVTQDIPDKAIARGNPARVIEVKD